MLFCCLKHPGGKDILEEMAGKNATKQFGDVGHSKDAIELMKKYCIGYILDDNQNLNSRWKFTWTVLGSALVISFFVIIIGIKHIIRD